MAQIKSRKFNLPLFSQGDGAAAFINDSAAVTVAQAVNDTIDFKIPKGLELSFLRAYATDMDTGTPALAFKVGFAPINGSTVVANGVSVSADDDYFSAAAALGGSAGGTTYNFPPVVFEEDVYLRFTCTTIAATFAAGTLSVSMGGAQVGVK